LKNSYNNINNSSCGLPAQTLEPHMGSGIVSGILGALFLATHISGQTPPPLPCSSGAAELCTTASGGGCCIVSQELSSSCSTPQNVALSYSYASGSPALAGWCAELVGNSSALVLGQQSATGVPLGLFPVACATVVGSGQWFALTVGVSPCETGPYGTNFTLTCLNS